ncbi:hypothetical protein, partial [Vibrio cholerae]|uniref:hypothetical protein n=1 Tax=Vibrio cholerae TaxID=666 RepID=UPI001F38DC64
MTVIGFAMTNGNLPGGSAIMSNASALNLQGCIFPNNMKGAIYSNGPKLAVTGCTFKNHTAGNSSGGALVAAQVTNLTLTNNTFTN